MIVAVVTVTAAVVLSGCRREDASEAIRSAYEDGKQLRAEKRYEAAMQRLTEATHYPAGADDAEVLGRVYSNIAGICQSEGSFDLAYDMHVVSADWFRRAGCMTNYYYAINNMALQRTRQLYDSAEEDKASIEADICRLLRQIEESNRDSGVIVKVTETKALANYYACRYDSALYYVNRCQAQGYNEPAGYMIKAQAFSEMGQSDSARYYARLLTNMPLSSDDRNSICYIMLHNDSSGTVEDMRRLGKIRGEVLQERVEEQKSLSRAVELLEYDLANAPAIRDRRLQRMAGLSAGVLAVAVIAVLVLLRYRRRHTAQYRQVEDYCELLAAMPDRQLQSTLYWSDYGAFCGFVDSHFNMLAQKLEAHTPELKDREIQLCVLVLIGMNNGRIAKMMNYSESGIGKFKYLVAKKFRTSTKQLPDRLKELVCAG